MSNSEAFEQFPELIMCLADDCKIGFSIQNEAYHKETFFHYSTGLPIAVLPGMAVAEATLWPKKLLLVKAVVSDTHPAKTELVFNEECREFESAAKFATVAMVQRGFDKIKALLKPQFTLKGVDYYAVEDIALKISSELDTYLIKPAALENSDSKELAQSSITSALDSVGALDSNTDQTKS